MHIAPQSVETGLALPPGHLSPRRDASAIIDFLDEATVSEIEEKVRAALGSGCLFDFAVDEDAWAIEGNEAQFIDLLTQIARDASVAMQGEGVLHMCVLNVFDRCGGDRDQVLVAISHAGDPGEPRAPAGATQACRNVGRASGIARAITFAAENEAEFDFIGGRDEGTSISLLHPRFRD